MKACKEMDHGKLKEIKTPPTSTLYVLELHYIHQNKFPGKLKRFVFFGSSYASKLQKEHTLFKAP